MRYTKLAVAAMAASLAILVVLLAYKLALSRAELSEGQQQVIDYVGGGIQLHGNFTREEHSHLDDVKNVMYKTDVVFLAVLIAAIALGISMSQREWWQSIMISGISGAALTMLAGLAARLNFAPIFSIFHYPLFRQGTWVFPPTSALITLFPISFFASIAKEILIISLLLFMGFLILSLIIRKAEQQ